MYTCRQLTQNRLSVSPYLSSLCTFVYHSLLLGGISLVANFPLLPLQKEQLRIAIMDYLNHHNRQKEKMERLQLVALKFKMFRELAKVKEQQAIKEMKRIKPKNLGC